MNPWWLLLIVPASAMAGFVSFIAYLEFYVKNWDCDFCPLCQEAKRKRFRELGSERGNFRD